MSSSTDVPVGVIGKPHGVRGEVTVAVLTDFPERFEPGATFPADDGADLVIASVRRHHGKLLIRFEGYSDRGGAESLRGITLTIPEDERHELEEGEYWPDALEGMAVVRRDGTRLGTVSSLVLGDHQDRLVVTAEDGSLVEVPFVEPIVGEVHPSGGFIVLDPPDGLF